MSFRLSVLKTNVTKTFIIVAFISFADLKNENRLLLKIDKIFTRLFFIKDFSEFNFLREIIMIII